MTYTILGRCPRTARLGIGVATYSLGVGGYCPVVKQGLAALSSQAFANPGLRGPAVELLERGVSPEAVFDELRRIDEFFDYRQFGIVTQGGHAACHTGDRTRAWAGHTVGDGFVAMGNVLEGKHVVEAIAGSFESTKSEELEERLLQAIEAGCAAGGQGQLNERSAALIDRDVAADQDQLGGAHRDANGRIGAGHRPAGGRARRSGSGAAASMGSLQALSAVLRPAFGQTGQDARAAGLENVTLR